MGNWWQNVTKVTYSTQAFPVSCHPKLFFKRSSVIIPLCDCLVDMVKPPTDLPNNPTTWGQKLADIAPQVDPKITPSRSEPGMGISFMARYEQLFSLHWLVKVKHACVYIYIYILYLIYIFFYGYKATYMDWTQMGMVVICSVENPTP